MKTLLKIFSIALLSFLLNGEIFSNGIKKLEPVSLPPALDGKLDEIYLSGVSFINFVQLEPDILTKPSVKTEIYFLYDSKNIYIAGKLFQSKATIKSSNG